MRDKKAIKQMAADEKKSVKKIKAVEKKERGTGKLGHISQVMGAVVDVKFDAVEDLPPILTAFGM